MIYKINIINNINIPAFQLNCDFSGKNVVCGGEIVIVGSSVGDIEGVEDGVGVGVGG